MNCPVCSRDSRVLKTTDTERRRECLGCGHRFTTKEVLKDDHQRQEAIRGLMQKLQEQL
jgi:transcriptional regulator NrdR family protein